MLPQVGTTLCREREQATGTSEQERETEMETVVAINSEGRCTTSTGRKVDLEMLDWKMTQTLAENMRVNRGMERGRPSRDALAERIEQYLRRHPEGWNLQDAPRDSEPMPLPDNWNEPEPTCPRDGAPMVLRTRRSDGQQFWGCSNYRRDGGCHGTRPYHKPEPKPIPQPSEPFPNPEFPITLYCPTGNHPPNVAKSQADIDRWAGRCGICGADMQAGKPDDAPRSEYVEELEAEILTLTERAEKAEQKIRNMQPPIPSGERPTHKAFPQILSALQAGVDAVYCYGPPGTGKTEIGRSVSEAMSLPLIPFSCHPLMTENKLMGYQDANGNYHPTGLRTAVENGGIYILDEIDNGNPSLIAALNSLISNSFIAFPDAIIEKHPDFRLIATANTWGTGPTAEFVGRNGLDLATLDRMTRIVVDIDDTLESRLVHDLINADAAEQILHAVRTVRERVTEQGLRIIVSPRMSLQTAKLMVAGWDLKDALLTTSLAAVDDQTRSALLRDVI